MAEEKRKVPANPEEEKLAQNIDEVLRTEAGRAFWAFLARRLGFFETSLVVRKDGEIAQLSTDCKEAQRLVYLELRRRASRELLAVAEQLAETPVAVVAAAAAAALKPEEERR